MKTAPQFLVLSEAECADVLARNHIGRLAFRHHDRVDIQPLAYVAREKWVFLRSAYGAKLEALSKDPFVAFEVDEIDGPFDWRSVVVHGTVYVLSEEGGPVHQREARRALDALRSVMPGALSADDPVPERHVIYGLNIQEISGRAATSASARRGAATGALRRPSPRTRKAADNF